jgi:hypothetical protein
MIDVLKLKEGTKVRFMRKVDGSRQLQMWQGNITEVRLETVTVRASLLGTGTNVLFDLPTNTLNDAKLAFEIIEKEGSHA